MRPTPNQLIRGIRDLLRQSVAPEVVSDQGILSLRKIMGILREFDWDEAAFVLSRENDALRAMACEIVAWSDEDARRSVALHPVLDRLQAILEAPESSDSFAAIRLLNDAYRHAIGAFLDAVDHADVPGCLAAAAALRGSFARRLANLGGCAVALKPSGNPLSAPGGGEAG
jgi:hypothetical protein